MFPRRFVHPLVATEVAVVAGVALVAGYLRLLQHLDRLPGSISAALVAAVAFHAVAMAAASSAFSRSISRSDRANDERDRWIGLPGRLALLAAALWFAGAAAVGVIARRDSVDPDLVRHLWVTLPLVPGGLAAATAFFEYEHAVRLLVEETLSTLTLGRAVRTMRTRIAALLVGVAIVPLVVVGTSLWHVVRDHGSSTPGVETEHSHGQQQEELSHQHEAVIRILLSVGGAAAGAALLFGVFVARSLTHPVLRLTQGMTRVRGGAFDTRLPVATRDELGLAVEAFNGMAEGLAEREWLRDSFGRYVSRDVAEALREGRIAVEGEIRTVTVLFCDVRGFTRMSEDLPPHKVLQFVNQYVRTMSEVVGRHRGRVDKVIGDGLLVVFGAPLADADHAKNAVRAALEMRAALVRMNETRTAEGLTPVKIGVGLHSGEVIAGNVGLESHKLEYTVLGDTVNVASRIEGLTKELGTDVLVSESTVAAAGPDVQTIEMPEATLRGRQSPIRVFGLAGG